MSNSWNSISDFYCTISSFFEINPEIVLFYSLDISIVDKLHESLHTFAEMTGRGIEYEIIQ